MTPCRVLPKPLDVPDQQTSLVRFLIEELGVPHIAITTIQHDSQPVNLPPFPLLPHRDSNQQNPAPQIVKWVTPAETAQVVHLAPLVDGLFIRGLVCTVYGTDHGIWFDRMLKSLQIDFQPFIGH
ncbi:hypothetical protein AVEN_211189-1 [Araneus ventricosus]|uniref:Uncharacterized protein n=1 Tax=Araneus ventricosus TaxID=182803 RepID=A0A4Y2WKM4_ARAVE|nr:hypothetical protein AVEN_211189-1 [Araneus ventricosus]